MIIEITETDKKLSVMFGIRENLDEETKRTNVHLISEFPLPIKNIYIGALKSHLSKPISEYEKNLLLSIVTKDDQFFHYPIDFVIIDNQISKKNKEKIKQQDHPELYSIASNDKFLIYHIKDLELDKDLQIAVKEVEEWIKNDSD